MGTKSVTFIPNPSRPRIRPRKPLILQWERYRNFRQGYWSSPAGMIEPQGSCNPQILNAGAAMSWTFAAPEWSSKVTTGRRERTKHELEWEALCELGDEMRGSARRSRVSRAYSDSRKMRMRASLQISEWTMKGI